MPLNVILFIRITSLQYPVPFGVDVFKLTAVDGPAQDGQDGQHEQNRHGNQDEEDFHDVGPSLRELSTTPRELSAMPRPAAQGGSRPISASGMQLKL